MSRYIDADALLSKGHFVVRTNDFGERFVTVEEINKMPTVDAVEVVRCGECRFYKPWSSDGEYGKCKTGLSVMADMFCSCGSRADGERRTDEQQSKG